MVREYFAKANEVGLLPFFFFCITFIIIFWLWLPCSLFWLAEFRQRSPNGSSNGDSKWKCHFDSPSTSLDVSDVLNSVMIERYWTVLCRIFCIYFLWTSYSWSQWSSSSTLACGVRGIEPVLRTSFCVFTKITAVCCTLTAVSRLAQTSTLWGMVNEYRPHGWMFGL